MSAAPRTFDFASATRVADLRTALTLFGVRGWTFALAGAIAMFLLIGIPASLVDNPIFDRQLAARPQDYVIWAVSIGLGGLIAGTFAIAPLTGEVKTISGGVLSTIAVGCPICNKVAVTLLGTSGALNIFGPTQIFIGIASLALLAWTLLLRTQAIVGACPTVAGSDRSTEPVNSP
jgi:hypothetical protein